MKRLRKEDLTRIGIIRKSSGYKGAVICQLDVESKKISKKKFFFVLLEGFPVPFEVEEAEFGEYEMKVKFFDLDSEDQARKIVQKEIFAEKFSEKKKNKIESWTDLVNFLAEDETYGELGIITNVVEYPQQMIAHCMVKKKEVLFPLNEEIVVNIDYEKRIVVVDLPEGLLDLYLIK